MRIGIDVRPLQFSGVQRGFGQYVRELIGGLAKVPEPATCVFLHLHEKPFPEGLDGLPSSERVPLHVPGEWTSLNPIWLHPRVRNIPVLPGRAKWRFLATQGEDLGKAAVDAKLDVLFLPAPVEPHLGPIPKLPVPSLFTFHDAIPFQFREHFIDTWDFDAQKLIELQRRSYANADLIVSVSESARNDAIQYYDVSPDRVVAVPNGIDPSFGRPVDPATIATTRKKYRLQEPFLLFCSLVDWHKNMQGIIPGLARALETLDEPLRLAVVGPLVPNQRDTVRALAFDAGLTGKDVIMPGFVSFDELKALFQSATALISPSIAEGFGIPVVQAMFSGTPVIASNISAQPEVVGDAGLLVDPYDVDAIAEAIVKLAKDQVLRSQLAEKGKAQALKFTAERQAQGYFELFKRLAKTPA